MQINERRRILVNNYLRTWSIKSAVKAVSKRFKISEGTLRADWNRRQKWPKQVFNHIRDPMLSELYHMGIHRTLQQIEDELVQNANPNCRVGLLKAKAEILFKLMEIQVTIVYQEDLMKKMEKIEEKLRFLEADKQKNKVK